MSQQTLKELLKTPFSFNVDAVGDYFITDKSKRLVLKIPALKAKKIFADFTVSALNEKWERDFGEPMRWEYEDDGEIKCPKCNTVLTFSEQPDWKTYQYCPHCGQRLLPPCQKPENE
jgi:uncharacterized CHY-type Zn-finger protein